MAKTPLERKRKSLALKAERERLAGDPTDKIATTPFNEWVNGEGEADYEEVRTSLKWAGIAPKGIPAFDADDDPGYDSTYDVGLPNRRSIGRAERMIENLLDAATGLASIVNAYKKAQVEKSIADLEARDLSDPNAKKAALAEIIRLSRLRDRLEKQVRHTMPEYRVKGG